MRKTFTITLLSLFMASGLFAQLADGSIAPDFTAVDINGNEWNLYDILDQGKSVVLDVSTTWCGPCWTYHQTGALEELFEAHGPNGTDDFFVFMIEADPETNVDCLYGPENCNGTSLGDWTEGVEYPIVDNADLANLYEVAYYPTLYQICPNRLVTEIGQLVADDIYDFHADCAVASGSNNAGILSYSGFEGSFCSQQTFSPEIKMQNLGSDELTSASIELYVNGALTESFEWTGALSTYQIATVQLGEMTVTSDTDLEITIIKANNVDDEDMDNNTTNASLRYADVASDNVLKLELMTDGYPAETTWNLKDSEGRIFYESEVYTELNTLYKINIDLPSDGCYEFEIYDTYGDGICCIEGDGFYRLLDSDDNVIIEGGEFEFSEISPFEVAGAGSIANNGAIINYSGESGYVCGDYTYNPIVSVQNLGSDAITTMKIETSLNGTVIATTDWTGDIATGDFEDITLEEVLITGESIMLFTITEINGELDTYEYQNDIGTSFFDRLVAEETSWNLELQLGTYAFEIYWQITNSAGELIDKGGNEEVGPDGGLTGGADPTAEGAYAPGELVNKLITLPENINDCYDFLLVDSYGDGLVDGGGGFVKLTGVQGEVILDQDLTEYRFSAEKYIVNVDAFSNTDELQPVSDLVISPNPTNGFLQINFDLSRSQELNISVFDPLGKHVKTISQKEFSLGQNNISADLTDLTNGLYSLRMSDGRKVQTKKFTIIK